MGFDNCGEPKSEAGFTLLELLVSLVLLCLVLIIVSGGFNLAIKSFKTGENKAAALERNRASLRIIISQIQSFTPVTFMEANGNRSFHFRGGSDSLRLATGYSAWSGGRAVIIVEYRTEAAGNSLQLLAKESSNLMGTREDLRLFENLSYLRFEYFLKQAGEEKGEWVDEWQETISVPEKIRLSIKSGGSGFSFIIPVRAREALNVNPGSATLPG